MNDTTPPPSPLSLHTYLHVLRRQRGVILGIVALTLLLGTLPSLLRDPVYASVAEVQASPLDREGVFSAGNEGDLTPIDRSRELATDMEILASDSTRQKVVAALGDDVGFDDPEVEPLGWANAISIRVTAADPAVAADVANTYAEVFIEDRRERATGALVTKAEELREQSVEANAQAEEVSAQLGLAGLTPSEVSTLQARQTTHLAQALEYQRRADDLMVEASLRGRGTRVISAAVPDPAAVAPQPMRSALVALTIGILLAIGIAVLVDTVQDKINSAEDLGNVRPDRPVLASVPHVEPGNRDEAGAFAMREAFRYLRTSLRVQSLRSPLRSLLITSAVGGEGKTTALVELARATAEVGDRVVLVDCDLRRPTLHEQFGLPNDRGLSSLVLGDESLDDVVHFVDDNLAVVTAGPRVQNPPEVLSSEVFARVLASIVAQADLTLLDAPPVLPVADALIAGQLVDGIVAVSRMGEVRRRQVRELFKRLDASALPVVGIVANDVTEEAKYGYYEPERPKALPDVASSFSS